LVTPQVEGHETVFAITDQKGRYKLQLAQGVWYGFQVISLGYSTINDTLQFAEDTIYNFTMRESVTTLEEVQVKAKMAMVVNEDTITYRVKHFETGSERKLREILKKLPGVEVDRKGNVTVNGKKVNK